MIGRKRTKKEKVKAIKDAFKDEYNTFGDTIKARFPKGKLTVYRGGTQIAFRAIGWKGVVTKAYDPIIGVGHYHKGIGYGKSTLPVLNGRYLIMKRLFKLGAPVADPIKQPYVRGGLVVWKERQLRGIPVNEAMADWRIKSKVEEAYKKANKKLKEAANKLGLEVEEPIWLNSVYDPKTNRVFFTDAPDLSFDVKNTKDREKVLRWLSKDAEKHKMDVYAEAVH
jgi:hypothetical protein